MADVPYPSDYERLRGNIRRELEAQRVMADLDLDDKTLDRLAERIAVSVDYAFTVHWAPKWVKNGDPHRWTEPLGDDPAEHFVECLRCKRITVHRTAAEANAWYARHSHEENRSGPLGRAAYEDTP